LVKCIWIKCKDTNQKNKHGKIYKIDSTEPHCSIYRYLYRTHFYGILVHWKIVIIIIVYMFMEYIWYFMDKNQALLSNKDIFMKNYLFETGYQRSRASLNNTQNMRKCDILPICIGPKYQHHSTWNTKKNAKYYGFRWVYGPSIFWRNFFSFWIVFWCINTVIIECKDKIIGIWAKSHNMQHLQQNHDKVDFFLL